MKLIDYFMFANNLAFNQVFKVYYDDNSEGFFCFVRTSDGKPRLSKIVLGGIDTSNGYLENVLLDLLNGLATVED